MFLCEGNKQASDQQHSITLHTVKAFPAWGRTDERCNEKRLLHAAAAALAPCRMSPTLLIAFWLAVGS